MRFAVVLAMVASNAFALPTDVPEGTQEPTNTDDGLEQAKAKLTQLGEIISKSAQDIGTRLESAAIDAAVAMSTDKNTNSREQRKIRKEFEDNVKNMKACLAVVDPIACKVAKEQADIALKVAEDLVKAKVYPQNSITDGKADAFRHCYWTALMARRIGSEKALKIADLHEEISKNPTGADSQMDKNNNAVGAPIGAEAKSDLEVQQKCRKAVEEGEIVESKKHSGFDKGSSGRISDRLPLSSPAGRNPMPERSTVIAVGPRRDFEVVDAPSAGRSIRGNKMPLERLEEGTSEAQKIRGRNLPFEGIERGQF